MKKYIPLKANDKATDLRVELTYDLGGYNLFDYTKNPEVTILLSLL